MKTVLNPPPLVRPAEDSLAVLAKRANAGHAACVKDTRSSLERAHETGLTLIEAQKKVYAEQGHEWLQWVEKNLTYDRYTAADYLRIAHPDNWERIEAERGRSPHMGVREALNLLAGNGHTPVLQPWDPAPPSPDQSTVASEALTHERAQTILEKLHAAATVPIEKRSPEEQRRAIEAEKAALAQRQHDRGQHEHSDDRTRRLKRAGAHIAGARRDLLGLGHEAATVVADLDRVAGEIADLKEG